MCRATVPLTPGLWQNPNVCVTFCTEITKAADNHTLVVNSAATFASYLVINKLNVTVD